MYTSVIFSKGKRKSSGISWFRLTRGSGALQRSSRQAQYLGKIWGILLKDFGVTLTSLLLSCPLLYGKLAVLEMIVKPDFEKSGVDSQEEDYYQVEGHVEGV